MTDVKPLEAAKQPEKTEKVEKPVFIKSTSQLDVEARLKVDNAVPAKAKTVNPPAPDDSGFIGTDPIYQGRANETDLPGDDSDDPAMQAYIKAFEKPDHEKAARQKAAVAKAAEKS